MLPVAVALHHIRIFQDTTRKPSGVILAGHNGSGKSTLWRTQLADEFVMPLINADRMMLSVLPELAPGEDLPSWAIDIRDRDDRWMQVAQKGVEAFVTQAMKIHVPFAMETVFSHWQQRPDGTMASKIDLIHQLQSFGYFTLLIFVGLARSGLSVGRVQTRIASGGHNVDMGKLLHRFPRTQAAIRAAAPIADATLMLDNSGVSAAPFGVCRLQFGDNEIYDCRTDPVAPSPNILEWLDIVSPRTP